MRWTAEKRINAGLVLAACVLAGVIAYATYALRVYRAMAEGARLSLELHTNLGQLLSALKDVETGTRGFILTGDERFLAPYHEGRDAVAGLFAAVQGAAVRDPVQARRVAGLEPLITARLERAGQQIGILREQGLEAAVESVAAGTGRELMDEIRGEIAYLQREEQQAFSGQLAAARAGHRHAVIAMGAGAAFGVLLLGGVFLLGRRERRVRDIVEATVRQARAHAESIVETVRQPLVILTEDLRVHGANRAFHTTYGTSPAEIEGRRFSEIMDGAWDSPTLLGALGRVVPEAATLDDFEFTREFPGQGARALLLSARKLFRPGNHTNLLLLAIEDVTLRRQVADDERRDRHMFQLLFDESPDALVLVDQEGTIVRANTQAESLFGHPRGELHGCPIEVLIPVRHRQHHEGHRRGYARAPRARPMGEGLELFGMRRDGTEFPVDIMLSPLETDAGRQTLAVVRDVTERKEAEARIRTLNLDLSRRAAQLESANRELEAFSYSVSHDLRAPVRHVSGFAQMLQQHSGAQLDERGRRLLDTINQSARQMSVLIDELLAFSRLGRAGLQHGRVELASLVAETIAALAPDTADREIEWRVDPLPVVEADRAMLRQVFVNLLGNAVKYTRKAKPARIQVTTQPPNGSREVVVSVRDNGAGFDMRYAHKLFQVFSRLHHAAEFEGTGVGLATVRRIIERHGGRVWAESEPGAGATFHFSLPLADPNL